MQWHAQKSARPIEAVAIGGSAGATQVLTRVLSRLPAGFPLPILAVCHLHVSDDGMLAGHLAACTLLPVTVPCDKEPVEPGRVYVAPANYHLLVEREKTLALSVDGRVLWSRPSIDVLFESAARVWGPALCGIILSGANSDGANGMRAIEKAGGMCLAQAPETAQSPVMPQAALDAAPSCRALSPAELAAALMELGSAFFPKGDS